MVIAGKRLALSLLVNIFVFFNFVLYVFLNVIFICLNKAC